MKVVIVGMMKSQLRHVTPDFPALDIKSVNREIDGREDDQVLAHADRILLMTKFVSHSLQKKLDRSKVTLVNGGLTRLREVLKTIDATDAIEVGRSPITIAEQFEEIEMKAKYDFSPFKHAKVGDVLTFHRAPEHNKAKFDSSVQVGRSYYKINFGVITEMHRSDNGDKIEVLVTGLQPTRKETIQDAVKREHAASAGETLDQGISEPAPVAAPEKPVLAPVQDMDRRFWQEVYLQTMKINPGSPGSWHEDADNAINYLRNKMGG